MLKIFKPKKPQQTASDDNEQPSKPKLFGRLLNGLSKTRQQLTSGLANVILGKKEIDQSLIDEIEMQLLTADVGMQATDVFMENLKNRLARKELADSEAVMQALHDDMLSLLKQSEAPLVIPDNLDHPFVILMIGINGAGKTTTIGKIAKQLQSQGKKVMLAAGDTFRAAAVEQLQVWGERNDIPVIAQKSGADSASVAFDALSAAKARQLDVLIVDTAGRLHTQDHLMNELKKIKRVISKVDENAPHEVMLVLDASIGQNALQQAEQFQQAVDVTSICMTKLDGTAKGGIIFAIAQKLGLPIRYIGVGEGIEDLRTFNANEFTDALFDVE